MSNWFQKYFILLDIIVAVLLLVAFDRSKHRSFIKRYKLTQERRATLSEADFCERLSIDENNASFVRAIRESLAKHSLLNPERIYPEDKLWHGFDFEIVEVFDEPAKKYFYENYEYFCDDVKCVGDLVKFLIQIRTDAKFKNSIKR